MEKIMRGVATFHRTVTDQVRPRFAKLVKDGQSPRALFITCADSRIDPSLITTTDPGDLFIIRNIGNLVPSYELVTSGHADSSVPAAIEYSLEYLNIRNVIICGHSDCGAMKAVQTYRDLPESSLVRAWLANAEEALTGQLEGRAIDPALSDQNRLAQLNVLVQLTHLKEYPVVKKRLEAGQLNLHGFFLDIENAEVRIFHPGRNRFVRLDEETIEELRFFNNLVDKTPEMRLNLHNADTFPVEPPGETTGDPGPAKPTNDHAKRTASEPTAEAAAPKRTTESVTAKG